MFNFSFLKLNKIPILLALTSVAFYLSFGYDLVRTDIIKLISLYSALFFLFYKLVQTNKENFKFLVALAVLFRLLFLFATPNLSQDFYRFIWDGRMILEGFNPYLYSPESFILNDKFPIAQAQELYNGMGVLSGSHLTNYTPLNQLCFVIAGLFSGKSILGSVVIMRLFVIAADFGTLYFGKKLLEKLNIPIHTIFWYILNPFIIIELTGNLHFEGVMIFFLIWSLFLLHNGKWKMAAIIFACSVSIKLIPLIFLPLLFQWFVKKRNRKKWMPTFSGITKLIGFYAIVVGLTVLAFIPFYNSNLISNYFDTVTLWFQRFEFNASLYYIARAIGYTFRGYNEIAVIGKAIPIVVACFVLILTFFRKNKTTSQLITAMLFVLSFYYFTATTVHPWYLSTLVILSLFTKYKFPLVWSFVIILSYLAYENTDNTENLWVVGTEYIVVYGFLIGELLFKKTTPLVAQT